MERLFFMAVPQSLEQLWIMILHETTEYLELFLRNLLLDETNELHNRSMHISGILNNDVKADIETAKADIESAKADIEEKMRAFMPQISEKTLSYIFALYDECGKEKVFGRSFVEEITGLKSTRASELLKSMSLANVIHVVKGRGKGKYCFIR